MTTRTAVFWIVLGFAMMAVSGLIAVFVDPYNNLMVGLGLGLFGGGGFSVFMGLAGEMGLFDE